MDSTKTRVLIILGFVLIVFLIFLNQITTSDTPTSIYTPGPRQPPLTAPTRSPGTPHPGITKTTAPETAITSAPEATAPAPKRSEHHLGTRNGVRAPLRGHTPGSGTTRPPRRPPSHHPQPTPAPTPTPHPPPPPQKPPGVLCRILGVCINTDAGLGVWLHP